MKLAPAAPLLTYLDSTNQFFIARLFTFALPRVTLRWTGWDRALTTAAGSFTPVVIQASGVRQAAGGEVSSVDLHIAQGTFAAPPTVEGVALATAAEAGAFDGAGVTLQRLFLVSPSATSSAYLPMPWFQGRVADVKPTALGVDLTVKAGSERLNRPFPFRVFQPTCPYALYSPACGVTRADLTRTVQAGSTASVVVVNSVVGSALPDMTLGTITAGYEVRQIQSATLGGGNWTLTLTKPLLSTPAGSVTLAVGCNKTTARCNVLGGHFGGFPFVPAPETVYTLPTK